MSQYNGNNGEGRRRLTPEQKHRILQMRKRRRMVKRLKIIVPIAVAVIALAIVLLCVLNGGSEKDEAIPAAAVLEATPAATVLATPEVTSTPAPTATPEPVTDFNFSEAYVQAALGNQDGPVITADYSKVDPAKLDCWPETEAGNIPVLYKAETEEKIVAITVDDCNQAENLRQIIQCALDNNNSMLTIFPIGRNLERESIAELIKWAWESGMEIENHTYNHAGMYHYDDERMTSEIYYQNAAVSKVLGVNYQMHFFRPKGGDERADQRVHAYVDQLGYSAIAMWNKDGSLSDVDTMLANLAPGNVYLFHTTDTDLRLLLELIPAIVQRGYRLVTLNEMFGLPENETSDLSTLGEKPYLQPFEITPHYLKRTAYVRAAAIVQQRLIDLGWMEGEADGVFGKSSYLATGFFQMACGDIKPTGEMDAQTQMRLFADDAPRGTPELIKEYKKKAGK